MENTLSQLNGFVYNAYSLGFLKKEAQTSIENFFEDIIEENNYINSLRFFPYEKDFKDALHQDQVFSTDLKKIFSDDFVEIVVFGERALRIFIFVKY